MLDEPRIADALEWQRLRRADLTQAERDFIEVSVNAAAARRRRRRRYRFGVVALVAAIALAAGGYAIQQRENGNFTPQQPVAAGGQRGRGPRRLPAEPGQAAPYRGL